MNIFKTPTKTQTIQKLEWEIKALKDEISDLRETIDLLGNTLNCTGYVPLNSGNCAYSVEQDLPCDVNCDYYEVRK